MSSGSIIRESIVGREIGISFHYTIHFLHIGLLKTSAKGLKMVYDFAVQDT